MKSSIKKLPKSIIELTIEENKENIAKYRNKVLNDLRKNADIKGFRKGANIPEEIIVKNYGEDRISSLMIDEALNKIYSQALRENNILPISQGEIKEIVSQDPLIVIMHIEVFPEIEIEKGYKKIKLPKTKVLVNDDEVEATLKEIQNKFTKFEEAGEGYEPKMGDKLYINTQGFDLNGNNLENTNMENYPLVLGSKILVPGFEEGLIGKKAGEKLTLDIEFPKDYHNEGFKGKKTKFEVEILKIESSIIPEFTLEFIKNLRGKDLDLAGFRALIKEELIETKESNARLQDENKLMDELLKISKIDFGDSLLKNQIQKVYTEIKENITNSGAKVYDYIASLGLSEEDYIEKNVKPIAIKRLQAELILHKLVELEKVEISSEELEKEIEKILSRFGSSDVVDRLKELYKPGTKYYEELSQRLVYRNLIDSFFE
ncbi:MAG: trigger factor [Candidatus Gracilibacteria bacterium]|nr:trigger factor [Candidatus Gracilibacteria bacterium]